MLDAATQALLARRSRRVRGRARSLDELVSSGSTVEVAVQARILGLDPGSRFTGFAVLECNGSNMRYVASGVIRATGTELPIRLRQVFTGVAELMAEHRPDEVAIESVFLNRNVDSALKLGQARGAALAATFATAPAVFEYAPRQIKQAVVGTGAAEKTQVQLMVRKLLNISGSISADAADAIAVALCHAHSRRLQNLMRSGR